MTAVDYVGRVVAALEKLSIPYMVVGAFSSNLYGLPRSTRDADFVVQLGSHSIAVLAAEIGPDFQLDRHMSFETITSTTRYKVVHRNAAFVVELFLLSDDPHDQARFARRTSGNIGGRQTTVLTAEDVVVTKLRWSRHGGRAKDLEDASNVIAVQGTRLNIAYIRRWTDLHGTTDLLERLLSSEPE